MPGATFIKNLKVAINQREVFDSNQLYHYKAFFDVELNYPQTAKDSYFSVAGYLPEGITMNEPNEKRREAFLDNREVQYIHKLSADLFNQNLYLISNVEMDIEITPNIITEFMLNWQRAVAPAPPPAPAAGAADAAAINAEIQRLQTLAAKYDSLQNYIWEIKDIRLMVKTLDLMDRLNLDISRHLDTQPARYGIRRTTLKHLFIDPGRFDFTANLFTDEVPRRVVLGLVATSNFMGSPAGSPFYFNHHNVREIQLVSSGRHYPQVPYKLNYEIDSYARAYHDTQENLGFANALESNGIDYRSFKSHYCLYVFQMTNSQEDTPGFELIKDGSTIVTIYFKEPVPAGGLQLIAYAENDGLVNIDQNRMVTVSGGKLSILDLTLIHYLNNLPLQTDLVV